MTDEKCNHGTFRDEYVHSLQAKLAQADRAIAALHRHCGCNVCMGISKQESVPDTSQLIRYRGALEQIANLPRCGDVRCRPLPENIARAALADSEKESSR